jgi:hypothetical protein
MASDQTFNYASRTYGTIRQDLLARASTVAPEWTDRDASDFGMLFVDLWSYMGDIIHYYVDRTGRESFISTATQRESLIAYANMFGYKPSGRESARGSVYISNSSGASAYTLPINSQLRATYDNINYNFYTTNAITIAPGTTEEVEVVEGKIVTNDVLTTSSSGAPNQAYILTSTDPAISTIELTVTEDGVNVPYLQYADAQDMSSGSRGFLVKLTSAGTVQVTFGNRINGFVPPAGSRITASYTRSSGVNGNIGSNLLSSFVESHPSYITISSSTPTTGGTNGETAESLKANIISSIRTQDRAVTLQDYADIAKSVSGVYKAVAAYTPASAGSSAGASVTVYALPFVSDFLTTSSYSITVPTPIKTAVVDKLSTRSMVGVTPVAASSVTLRRLDIIASIQVSEGFVKSWVEANVRNALDGLFTFDNADFGKELKKGEVYKLLMNLTGVDYIDISSFVIKDASNNTITTLDPSHVLRKGTITLTFSGGMGS